MAQQTISSAAPQQTYYARNAPRVQKRLMSHSMTVALLVCVALCTLNAALFVQAEDQIIGFEPNTWQMEGGQVIVPPSGPCVNDGKPVLTFPDAYGEQSLTVSDIQCKEVVFNFDFRIGSCVPDFPGGGGIIFGSRKAAVAEEDSDEDLPYCDELSSSGSSWSVSSDSSSSSGQGSGSSPPAPTTSDSSSSSSSDSSESDVSSGPTTPPPVHVTATPGASATRTSAYEGITATPDPDNTAEATATPGDVTPTTETTATPVPRKNTAEPTRTPGATQTAETTSTSEATSIPEATEEATATSQPTATANLTPVPVVVQAKESKLRNANAQAGTPTATPTATGTSTGTGTSTDSATATTTATATPTAGASATPAATPTAGVTSTAGVTPTADATSTGTATRTAKPTVTPAATPTSNPTKTADTTLTPENTKSATLTNKPTLTAEGTASSTNTNSATNSAEVTRTADATGSNTATVTNTPIPTRTADATATGTDSATETAENTLTAGHTLTADATPSSTPSADGTQTSDATKTSTATPLRRTKVPTPTADATKTPTANSTPTADTTQESTETAETTQTPVPVQGGSSSSSSDSSSSGGPPPCICQPGYVPKHLGKLAGKRVGGRRLLEETKRCRPRPTSSSSSSSSSSSAPATSSASSSSSSDTASSGGPPPAGECECIPDALIVQFQNGPGGAWKTVQKIPIGDNTTVEWNVWHSVTSVQIAKTLNLKTLRNGAIRFVRLSGMQEGVLHAHGLHFKNGRYTCTPPPVGEALCAGLPTGEVANGAWACNGGTLRGDKCPIVCLPGYFPDANKPTAACGGTVDVPKYTVATPRCIAKACKNVPTLSNPTAADLASGYYNCSEGVNTAGTRCEFVCNPGYVHPAGSRLYATCASTGDYAPLAQACIRACPPQGPSLPTTVSAINVEKCTSTLAGGSCAEFTCKAANTVPSGAAVCGQDGKWETSTMQCVPGCTAAPTQALTNAKWNCPKGVAVGQKCAAQCNAGMTLSQSSDLGATCVTGTFTFSQANIACGNKVCKADPPSGLETRTGSYSCSGAGGVGADRVNDKCSFTCKPGFKVATANAKTEAVCTGEDTYTLADACVPDPSPTWSEVRCTGGTLRPDRVINCFVFPRTASNEPLMVSWSAFTANIKMTLTKGGNLVDLDHVEIELPDADDVSTSFQFKIWSVKVAETVTRNSVKVKIQIGATTIMNGDLSLPFFDKVVGCDKTLTAQAECTPGSEAEFGNACTCRAEAGVCEAATGQCVRTIDLSECSGSLTLAPGSVKFPPGCEPTSISFGEGDTSLSCSGTPCEIKFPDLTLGSSGLSATGDLKVTSGSVEGDAAISTNSGVEFGALTVKSPGTITVGPSSAASSRRRFNSLADAQPVKITDFQTNSQAEFASRVQLLGHTKVLDPNGALILRGGGDVSRLTIETQGVVQVRSKLVNALGAIDGQGALTITSNGELNLGTQNVAAGVDITVGNGGKLSGCGTVAGTDILFQAGSTLVVSDCGAPFAFAPGSSVTFMAGAIIEVPELKAASKIEFKGTAIIAGAIKIHIDKVTGITTDADIDILHFDTAPSNIPAPEITMPGGHTATATGFKLTIKPDGSTAPSVAPGAPTPPPTASPAEPPSAPPAAPQSPKKEEDDDTGKTVGIAVGVSVGCVVLIIIIIVVIVLMRRKSKVHTEPIVVQKTA